jgi:hypothetical protein
MPRPLLLWALAACTPTAADPCDTAAPPSTCLAPTQSEAHYVEWSSAYFDTMDATVSPKPEMPYGELVARWEWPPWLKLTAFGRENILATDTLLLLYPSTVPERECRAFDVQPFGRCRVVFAYEAHENRPCPIYEEFTFNDAGEITFIEAWSDLPGLSPVTEDDPWGESEVVDRLSTRVPGLGLPDGLISLDGEAMLQAAEADPDVADLVNRANDWQTTWLEELAASGGDAMWEAGCGW